MKVSGKSKTPVPFPRKKIEQCVTDLMPKGKKFDLRIADSVLPNLKVVRIVTEAWKRESNADRILKVIKAVTPQLSEEENDRILRFSVLTPSEYKEILGSPASRPQRKSAVTSSSSAGKKPRQSTLKSSA